MYHRRGKGPVRDNAAAKHHVFPNEKGVALSALETVQKLEESLRLGNSLPIVCMGALPQFWFIAESAYVAAFYEIQTDSPR